MTDAGKQPEWRIAAAVLQQAMQDAVSRSGHDSLTLWDVQEAQRFCFDAAGVWAEARVAWCDAAQIEPEYFRMSAVNLLMAGASA